MLVNKPNKPKIGVLTSGGDAPGMNAVVRAVVLAAEARGFDVVGFKGGYSGLLKRELIDLTPNTVSKWIADGGTNIYSDRCDEFNSEAGVEQGAKNCRDLGIQAIVVIGGDGTFGGGYDLTAAGIPTIGIPGTIDNDITASDYTIGYDTAMNTAMELVDSLRDTCESHARCNIVEVMGRDCGWIALQVGIASGAIATIIPEKPFDEAAFLEKVRALRESGKRSMLVVVSEGVIKTTDGRSYDPKEKSEYAEFLKELANEEIEVSNGIIKNKEGRIFDLMKKNAYAEYLTDLMNKEFGRNTEWDIETKFCRPAHILRGDPPTLRDRVTATRMACKAVDLLLEGKSNRVLVEQKGEIVDIDIRWARALDHKRKGKLKEKELDPFSKEELDRMDAALAEWNAQIDEYYRIANICSF